MRIEPVSEGIRRRPPGDPPSDDGKHKPAGADARNRQPRGKVRREEILEAAEELFAANGYRGTGVASLGERVGMTGAGLLYYFGSKERLLHELVAERDRVDRSVLSASMTLDDLVGLVRHRSGDETVDKLYVVLAAESVESDAPLHDFFVDRYSSARSLVREMLITEQERSRIRADIDLEQKALEITSTVLGLRLQWLMDPENIDLPQAVETYVAGLFEALAP